MGCAKSDNAIDVSLSQSSQTSKNILDTESYTSQKDNSESSSSNITVSSSSSQTATDEIKETIEITDPIKRLLDSLTLKQKIGQLFIVTPEALNTTDKILPAVTAFNQIPFDAIETYAVGGVILFAKNIVDPNQLSALTDRFAFVSGIPLFISVDEEGGKVARLANNNSFDLPKYESAAKVGQSKNETDAFDMGKTIGNYLKQYRFNMNFAPVADVNTNALNPVIGDRAFSRDPKAAAMLSKAAAQGFASSNIIPTFKHFPGHGDTKEDSHIEIAVNNKTKAELYSSDWLPFLNATDSDCIMVGHIALPNVTGNNTPASFSKQIVTDILINELGFKGVIISDSLSMGAVEKNYPADKAAVLCFNAGCDILLMPSDLRSAISGITNAVNTGEISMHRLDSSVYKILSLKAKYGILNV